MFNNDLNNDSANTAC